MPSFQFRNPRIKGFYLRKVFRPLLLKCHIHIPVIASLHRPRVGKDAAHRGGRQDAGGVMLGHGGASSWYTTVTGVPAAYWAANMSRAACKVVKRLSVITITTGLGIYTLLLSCVQADDV